MALRDLETTQMVEISRRWTQSPMKEMIVSLSVVGAYYPVIEEVHQGLTLKQKPEDANQQAAEIRVKQTPIDIRHDDLLRGSFLVLSGLAALTESAEERIKYLHLRDTLHPFGLSGTQKTFREESGAAELTERALTEDLKKQLSQLPLPQEMSSTPSLLETLTERIAKGKQLGLLEDERDALLKAEVQDTTQSANEARLAWIDAITTFERLLKSAKAPAKDIEVLLAPLQSAQAIAEKRKNPPAPDATPDPVVTDKTEDKAD